MRLICKQLKFTDFLVTKESHLSQTNRREDEELLPFDTYLANNKLATLKFYLAKTKPNHKYPTNSTLDLCNNNPQHQFKQYSKLQSPIRENPQISSIICTNKNPKNKSNIKKKNNINQNWSRP